MNRLFTEEDIQITIKHMKRGSNSPAIREVQVKTTPSIKNTPIRMGEVNN